MAGDLPFSDLTVLDLGQVYLGPYCTLLMSRLGADIIKIEPPTGEPVRWRGAQVGVETSAFGLLNTGKRSLRLDLKSERGRDLFLQMAEDADVVVENFGPATLTRLGLGYDVLSERNPRLILASGRGYGPDGPYRDYLAMDLTVQAMSGVMATTGFADGPPLKAGPAVADFLGGIHLFGAIAAALV
jgi:crotonobetainyl-CoA:carnitine CoA-transferase CaiB-like acyl-CoA transferase